MRTRNESSRGARAFALALTLSLVTLAPSAMAGAAPSAASAIEREQAQSRFAHAKELFDAGVFAQALVEFQASLEIVNSPNTRLYVARCLRETGRVLDAYVELGRTALEAREAATGDGRYTLTADQAEAERVALTTQLAFVILAVPQVDARTTVTVGRYEIHREAWKEAIPVAPGPTELVVEAPGHVRSRQTVTLAAGERKVVTLALGPETSAAPPVWSEKSVNVLRPLAYGAGALGVAGLVVFAIEGASARSTYNELRDKCHGPCPDATYGSEISKGIRAQTIANIGLVVGGVGLAAGVTLYVLGREKSPDARTAKGVFLLSPSGIVFRGAL